MSSPQALLWVCGCCTEILLVPLRGQRVHPPPACADRLRHPALQRAAHLSKSNQPRHTSHVLPQIQSLYCQIFFPAVGSVPSSVPNPHWCCRGKKNLTICFYWRYLFQYGSGRKTVSLYPCIYLRSFSWVFFSFDCSPSLNHFSSAEFSWKGSFLIFT